MRNAILFATLSGIGLVSLLVVALGGLATPAPLAPTTTRPAERFSLDLQRPDAVAPTPAPQAATPDVVPERPRPRTSPPEPILPDATPEPEPIPQSVRPLVEEPPLGDVQRRRAQLARFGGTPGSESAVELGLAWLAAHQAPDGYWHRVRYQQQCPADDRCPGVAVTRTDSQLHVGLTGLCTLAFLGAGYNDEEGPYQDTVRRAIGAILRNQLAHGGFGRTEDMAGYNDSLATFALAEAYAQTRNPALREPLQRAVQRLVKGQQKLGGWDYLPRPTAGRNDTSITAWVIQALQAADAAGIEVPKESLVRATLHLARATAEDGRVWYSDARRGFSLSPQMQPVYRYGPAMTAAGLLSRMLLGMRSDSMLAERQTALLMGELPSEHNLTTDESGLHSHYYWYYGTVALFQRGGEDWQRWNARLRDALLPLQDRGVADKRRHSYGSWAPFAARWGKWGRMGGRVYTTALCVLTLETYYRHIPAYLAEDQPLRPRDWLAVLPTLSTRERMWAVDVLEAARLEQGEPVLVQLLRDESPRVQLRAALGLAAIGSPLGLPVLEQQNATATLQQQRILQRALQQGQRARSRAQAPGTLRVWDAGRGLATVALPHCYVGQLLHVRRGGRVLAELEIIQRFSQQDVSVARIRAGNGAPEAGDTVVEAARP